MLFLWLDAYFKIFIKWSIIAKLELLRGIFNQISLVWSTKSKIINNKHSKLLNTRHVQAPELVS